MSRKNGRRPKHTQTRNRANSGGVSQRRFNEDYRRLILARIRECCQTDLREDHQPGCIRQPGRCADKRAYLSKLSARGVAETMSEAYPDKVYQPYRCASCDKWHVGKPNEREVK